MFPIFQRYNFESNSQRMGLQGCVANRCFRYFKDTILKAIHNCSCAGWGGAPDVSDISKIQFWKQFTTPAFTDLSEGVMFPIFQRYNFESNSQLFSVGRVSEPRCFRYFKDTILKAIHNLWDYLHLPVIDVSDISKIQFWKQFTTVLKYKVYELPMFPIFQRYNLKTIQNYKHKSIFTSLDVSCHIKAT